MTNDLGFKKSIQKGTPTQVIILTMMPQLSYLTVWLIL